MSSRRSLLKSGTALATMCLGGCSTTLTPRQEFSLNKTILQSAIPRYLTDSYAIEDSPPEVVQFLLCDVSVNNGETDSLDFELSTDKDDYVPIKNWNTNQIVIKNSLQNPINQENDSGWIAFPIPRVETSEAFLKYKETKISLESAIVEDLASAPEFEVSNIQFSDGCVFIEVQNVGDAPGTFYFTIDNLKEGTWGRMTINTGKQVTAKECIKTYGDGVYVTWGGGNKQIEQ